MRSSRGLEFTEEAEDDFESLLDYTRITWGLKQRDLYADRISRRINELLSCPELGVARDDLAPGLRIHRASQHIIYYLVLEGSIRIVRILHARMNPALHLRESP